MTAQRPADFSLRDAVRTAGFTPRRDDLPGLLELLGDADEELVEDALRVATRLGVVAARAAAAIVSAAHPPRRGQLARLVGRVAAAAGAGADGDEAFRLLVPLLSDDEPRTRRAAAVALGKVPATRAVAAETALLGALDRDPAPDLRRAIVAALGKIGGPQALARLREIRATKPSGAPAGAELDRVLDRAELTLDRTLGRSVASTLDPTAKPPHPMQVVLHARAGVEAILAEEALALDRGLAPRVIGPGEVAIELAGSLASLYRVRTFLHPGFVLPPERGEIPEAVARALSSPTARAIFATWTRGPVRFRLAWTRGGHRRALTWACARAVAARAPELVNDPTGSPWEAVVDAESAREVRVALVPRRLPDPRFSYRKGDVPAASHPTLAAALVRLAGVRPDDVVWDPFAGSGTEVIERALAGPARALHATDRSSHAIEVARGNLAAAGLRGVVLTVADATRHVVPGVTLVLTNPPMGRRVGFGDVGPLLDQFIDHVATQLAPGGRLVWISPLPERTIARARRAGLVPGRRRRVDMGGFEAEFQVIERRA